jgi:thiosulfate dehydrogenase [quinone] large subunit
MEKTRVVVAATVLRLMLGWYMLADGLSNLFTPGWSASGFLIGAKTFPAFYAWFASPMNIWWVNPLNLWGITLVGSALILGACVRPAAWAGVALMLLYYFPHYAFPVVPNGFIVEDHLIDASGFALVALWPAARQFGLSRYLRGTFLGQSPALRWLVL